MNRRIFVSVVAIVILLDLGKMTIRLWERKTWASTRPGSISHDVADLSSVAFG